jgi:hypothetical protein
MYGSLRPEEGFYAACLEEGPFGVTGSCRPRRYDDITTSPRKTHGVERENAVVPPTQTHKGLPTRSWLKASGTPKDRVVGFLSEDPTRTYDALAEIKK